MNQKKVLWFVLAVCVLILAACKERGGSDKPAGSADVTEQPTVTVTEQPTATPTQKIEPTEAPTPTPTEEPEVITDPLELIAKSRELHESIKSGKEPGALGTGLAYSEQDKLDVEYGVSRLSGVMTSQLVLGSGREASYDTPKQRVFISGLSNSEAQSKINARVYQVSMAMTDPSYLPNVSGIVQLVQEQGIPEVKIDSYAEYNQRGILSVAIKATWEWIEKKEFASEEEFWEYRDRYGLEDSYYSDSTSVYRYLTYSSSEPDDKGVTSKYVTQVSETVGLTFDVLTGEELVLSDFFPEGYDYLGYINEELGKIPGNEFWFHHEDFMQNREIRGIGGERYYETKEYDGGAVRNKYTGGGSYYLSYDETLMINGQRVDLPFIPANRDPEFKACDSAVVYYETAALGRITFCDYGLDGPEVDTVKIGSFRIEPKGKKAFTVTVYRGKNYPVWSARFGRNYDKLVKEQFSDKKLLDIVKQSFSIGEVENVVGGNCSVWIIRGEIFPNNFTVLDVGMSFEVGYGNGASLWVKDGKAISRKELYDVSYEELLTGIFTGAEFYDGRFLNAEGAAKTAKALSPYFFGFEYPLTSHQSYWNWNEYLFRWK